MPCTTMHMVFADVALDAWSGCAGSAPFSVADAQNREAFLHGAVGPDMGFLPRAGSFRFVSELAHYCRPADLVRELAANARTPVQTAYAWGWLTHVLVDVEIHPVVGRACGEILRGDRGVRLNAIDSATTHISLEVGLDIALLSGGGGPAISTISPRAGLLPEDMGFVAAAFDAVYGFRIPEAELAAAHLRSIWLNEAWPRMLRALSEPPSLHDRAVAALARLVTPSATPVGAALRPIEPAAWVMDTVLAAVRSFPDALREVAANGLASVENRNLETGVLGTTDLDHPPAVSVLDRLEASWNAPPARIQRRQAGPLPYAPVDGDHASLRPL